jgi:hypothetical protein
MSRAEFRKECMKHGSTKKQADKIYREHRQQETWCNELYMVHIDRDREHGFGDLVGTMSEISVRRQDRGHIKDWRHMQEIKNQLVGEECEGCELYPAESRLRDSANQFWMYVFNDPTVRFPFGMFGRMVADDDFKNTKQRKL